ncbi:MAG: S8 family serine peptidase [Xanthobacteraceae bacterium]
MPPRLRNLLMTTTALIALGSVQSAAGPENGRVVGGTATIVGDGTRSVTVNQTSNRAIINWNTFNIGSGETTRFNQPNSSSVILNRVDGGLGPSVINGTLTANGRVFVINRDGMLFGRGAVINTAGFLASTNDIRNKDFMAGRYRFNIPGRPDASIVNYGNITATSGGFAALVAPGVRNTGTITATLGTVALASGNSFTLDMYGDRLIQVAVNDEIASKVVDVGTGKTLKSLVTNNGRISANGGRVELTAAAARHIVDSVINTRGVIEANSVGTRSGKIVLGATTSTSRRNLPKQTVRISGKLSATGKGKGEKGGAIQVTGHDIKIAGALIDASGHSGGGRILIGGDYGGGKPNTSLVNNASATLEDRRIPNATYLSVDDATRINASARNDGQGGKIILWANTLTTFAGTALARGGYSGGDGGFVEVSGKRRLAFTGRADVRAPYGATGTLLLDPEDFTINAIVAAIIANNLATANVTIMTGAAGTGDGDINVNSPVNWSSNNTFTLSAFRNVNVKADITNTGGAAVNLRADNTGAGTGTVNFFNNPSIDVSTSGAVSIFYNPTSYTTPTNYAGNVTGATLTAYMLVNNAAQLAAVESNLGGTYALGRNIDASPLAGADGWGTFTGIFDGQNRTISNLTMAAGSSPIQMNNGTIRNVRLTNVNITAQRDSDVLGGLAAINHGTISNVTVSGVVNGGQFAGVTAGGLVGINEFQITNSRSSVNVTGGGNSIIGGLVGGNGIDNGSNASIASSYATGAVQSQASSLFNFAYAGGLVGENRGSIQTSYATGNVSSAGMLKIANVGGLVGQHMDGLIDRSYTSGNVSINNTLTLKSDWSAAGGLVGYTASGTTITNAYALGNVSVTTTMPGYDMYAGGLIGQHAGSVDRAYSTGTVSATGVGNYSPGGFIGKREYMAAVDNSYWDTGTSGQAIGIGNDGGGSNAPISLSTSAARSQASFNFDFINTWFMLNGQTRPFLRAEHSTTIRNAHQLQLVSLNPNANYTLANDINLGPALANASEMWSPRGFVPIASVSNAFTGDFNGLGNTISHLKIAPADTTTQSIGMFAVIGAGGRVRNLTIADATVMANFAFNSSQVHQSVGILAGQSGGTIDNVTVSGIVTGGQKLGVIAGGLVGQHGIFGTGAASGTIRNSHADVAVLVGDGGTCPGPCNFNAAGGLVGSNVGGSLITQSSASGNVTGGAFVWAGGLVGQNGFTNPAGATGTITNSFATGNVKITGMGSSAGGLVGNNSEGSTIRDSQASGNVQSTFAGTFFSQFTAVGGLVGQNDGTISSTSAPAAGTGSAAATAANCSHGAAFSCASGNVTIATLGEAGGLVGSNDGTIDRAFATGAVRANGQTGVDSIASLGGLVGRNEGTIKNSFASGNVGNQTGSFVGAGGLVGSNDGTIQNSSASGTVRTGDNGFAGGLAGENFGTITNSSASGAVIGGTGVFAGGLLGLNLGSVTGSKATGNVSIDSGIAGGFAAINAGLIQLSSATGNVSSSSFAMLGGFVGMNAGAINQTYATGAVTGGDGSIAGGFVGLNLALPVDLNFSGGSHASARSASLPNVDPGTISQSYALGPVTGGNAAIAAAFAALNFGSLNQVYGVGRVVGGAGSTLGGLVASNTVSSLPGNIPDLFAGTLKAGTATNSFWDMQTTGITTSAGGTGLDTNQLASGLPSGFDPGIWATGSYPYLVNLGTQNTNPGNPVLPPQNTQEPPTNAPDAPNLPPANAQINVNNTFVGNATAGSSVVNTTQMVAQLQQQQQQQQRQQSQQPTGSVPPAPQPIRLDVGANRYFYLPPLNETRLITNEVVLQLPCNVPQATLATIMKQHNLTALGTECLGAAGNAVYRMRFASGQTIAGVIRALAAHQIIAAAQANYVYALTEPAQPAAPAAGDPGQYVPEKLHLPAIHRSYRGTNVSIAVIDSEIDAKHPDLSGSIAEQYDATGVEDNPHPHGTGMAGAIASKKRLLGVAPAARILAIRAFSSKTANAESTTFHILKGLDWAVKNGVRIVNMSFAGPRDPSLERALKAAHDKGVILIAAAGNAGPRSPPLYPAADPNVIAVTATDIDDKLFGGANRGRHVAIAAPGVDIMVPAPSGEYQMTTGTSVATAHISGVVALMLERNPRLTPADVRRILTASAKRLGPNNEFGAGLVDPVKALELAAPRQAAAPKR